MTAPTAAELQSLLFDCLHVDTERPTSADLAAMDAADWEHLGELAAQGQVSFQLYQRLMQPRLRASVSPALLERLRASAREQTLSGLALVATLGEILRACSAADVPVMVLKGMHLAHTVYEDVSARYMSDIDLLFQRGDLPRATMVFKSLGYQVPHDAASLIDLAPGNHEYALEHPRYGVNVDVHWSLTGANEAGIDEAEVWKRACSVTISGQPALGMSQEDLLAHLCFHASHHHFFLGVGLRPLVDVARLCTQSPQPDWQRLVERTRASGWGRGAYLTLSMAHRYLGVPVPQQVLADIGDAPEDLEGMHAAALASVYMDWNPSKRIYPNVLRLLNARSLRDQLALLIERLFPPREHLIQEFGLSATEELPPAPVLHLRRILRLVKRHAPRVWGVWRGDPAKLAELESQGRLMRWLDHPDHG